MLDHASLLLLFASTVSTTVLTPASTFGLFQGFSPGILQHPGIQQPPFFSNGKPEEATVCLTKGCVKAAANLINSMDESINPCDDFFQFACGQFMEQTTIPDHKSDYGTFAKVAATLEVRLRRIFESKSDPTEPKAYANVRGLYQSCMDTEAIKKSSEKELKAIIESLGGWPVLDGTRVDKNFKWLEKSFDAWEKGFNFEGLIAIDVVTDQKDATKRILEIDQPNLGLSREYLMEGKDAKSVKAYLNYMVDIAALLGADRALAEKDMAEALDLELQVAEISLPKEERSAEREQNCPLQLDSCQGPISPLPLALALTAEQDSG